MMLIQSVKGIYRASVLNDLSVYDFVNINTCEGIPISHNLHPYTAL